MPAVRVRARSHTMTRVRQTPRLFTNYLQVFFDLGSTRTQWRRPEITFRMRNGYVVACPNADGARFPLYEIFADDAYHLEDLLDGVEAGDTVLDIGGQIGCFSLAVAGARPDVKVRVYEASPTSAGFIRRNVRRNGLMYQVDVRPVAMAGRAGPFTFTDSGTGSGHNGLTGLVLTNGGHQVTVEAEEFDQAVAAAQSPVRVVKMDVEGAEYDIVLSSSPASWADVRKVVMEYHPMPGRGLDDLLDWFAALGLTPTRHEHGPMPGLGVIWLSRAG